MVSLSAFFVIYFGLLLGFVWLGMVLKIFMGNAIQRG